MLKNTKLIKFNFVEPWTPGWKLRPNRTLVWEYFHGLCGSCLGKPITPHIFILEKPNLTIVLYPFFFCYCLSSIRVQIFCIVFLYVIKLYISMKHLIFSFFTRLVCHLFPPFKDLMSTLKKEKKKIKANTYILQAASQRNWAKSATCFSQAAMQSPVRLRDFNRATTSATKIFKKYVSHRKIV